MNIDRATLDRIRKAFEATNSRDHRRVPPKGNNYSDPMAQADWESFLKGWQASREDLGEPVAYRFTHDAEHDNGVCLNATGLVEFDDYVWRDKTGWRNITALYALPQGGVITLSPVEWGFALKVADRPPVHEALQMFSEDPTGDAGTSLVRTVLEEVRVVTGQVQC